MLCRLDPRGMDLDDLRSLLSLLPEGAEAEPIRAFAGDAKLLVKPEQLCRETVTLPRHERRIVAFMFKTRCADAVLPARICPSSFYLVPCLASLAREAGVRPGARRPRAAHHCLAPREASGWPRAPAPASVVPRAPSALISVTCLWELMGHIILLCTVCFIIAARVIINQRSDDTATTVSN